jgi:hypothetical protein
MVADAEYISDLIQQLQSQIHKKAIVNSRTGNAIYCLYNIKVAFAMVVGTTLYVADFQLR